MKNVSSPLGCCIPSERQNMNPVFKQQYVNEGGKIKMAVPLSPMHYITNANIYGYDERFPPRFDPSYAYYNERIYKPRNMDFEYKEQKFVTPAMSFVSRPRRNMSAQVIDVNSQMHEISRSNSINFAQILSSINEKLSKIEFMCKNNQEDIYEIKQLIKPNQKDGMTEGGTRLVIRKLNAPETLKREGNAIKRDDKPGNSNIEPPNHSVPLSHNVPMSHSVPLNNSVQMSNSVPMSDELIGVVSEISRVDKMLDLSEELKHSNDMLERYVRNVKFDNLTCLENKLDVMSSDFAKIRGEMQPFDTKTNDVSILSNIESKFKKLFSRFDNEKSLELKPIERDGGRIEEGIVKLGEALEAPESDLKPMEINPGNLEITPKPTESPDKTSVTMSNEMLSGAEMMKLLKGLPLDGKINEIGLTEDEIVFLKNLNHKNSDTLNTAHTSTDNTIDINLVNKVLEFEKEDSDEDFGCQLLAPTRADFAPLVDDAIHNLNSTTFI